MYRISVHTSGVSGSRPFEIRTRSFQQSEPASLCLSATYTPAGAVDAGGSEAGLKPKVLESGEQWRSARSYGKNLRIEYDCEGGSAVGKSWTATRLERRYPARAAIPLRGRLLEQRSDCSQRAHRVARTQAPGGSCREGSPKRLTKTGLASRPPRGAGARGGLAALGGKRLVPTLLSTARDASGAPLAPRWRVLVNDDVDPDL